ncbi:MAG: orotate phosphoribosyltransferase [bacterium]
MNFKSKKEWNELRGLIRELSYEKRNVTLASGRQSDFYIDTKQTSLNSRGALLIGTILTEVISSEFKDAIAAGGITMGADPLATATSVISDMKGTPIHAFYIRKEPKGHGTGQWVEGTKNIPSGSKVVILEDVVTTGGSTLKSCDRAKEYGLNILGIISIVDREEGGRETIEAQGYKFMSLFTKTEIVQ